MITAEIHEDDYHVIASANAFMDAGEFGPLKPCGCCIVALEIDRAGRRLVFVMQRKDAPPHTHATLDDFASVLP